MISLLKIAQRDYWDKRQTGRLLVSPLVFSWELRELRLGRELFLCGPAKPVETLYVMSGCTDELDWRDAVLHPVHTGADVWCRPEHMCIHIHGDLLQCQLFCLSNWCTQSVSLSCCLFLLVLVGWRDNCLNVCKLVSWPGQRKSLVCMLSTSSPQRRTVVEAWKLVLAYVGSEQLSKKWIAQHLETLYPAFLLLTQSDLSASHIIIFVWLGY